MHAADCIAFMVYLGFISRFARFLVKKLFFIKRVLRRNPVSRQQPACGNRL